MHVCDRGRNGHLGETVTVGGYTIWVGGAGLGRQCLDEIATLVSLSPERPNLTSYPNFEQLSFLLPHNGTRSGLREFVLEEVVARIKRHSRLAIHCREGTSRTGMVLAALIGYFEPAVVDPIAEVRRRYCRFIALNESQARFVFGFADGGRGRPVPDRYKW
jgi:hypothetical protein